MSVHDNASRPAVAVPNGVAAEFLVLAHELLDVSTVHEVLDRVIVAAAKAELEKAQLTEALRSRDAIGRAKGVLMERRADI
ncbi:MAG TPA: ANTAR domain-containing protein [Pseudonocardia sp.]|jgi:AmiR/NasT family two-component response regulator|nr:ANTAR domain-containing protein [Pseudonocardia sp.]